MPDHRTHLLAMLANATAVYPLLAVGLIYVEWLLAWHELGHKPDAWIDHPLGSVATGWLHFAVSWLVTVWMLPAGVFAVPLNIAYVLKARVSAAQAGIRAVNVTGLWLGFGMWIARDPQEIIKWWSG